MGVGAGVETLNNFDQTPRHAPKELSAKKDRAKEPNEQMNNEQICICVCIYTVYIVTYRWPNASAGGGTDGWSRRNTLISRARFRK